MQTKRPKAKPKKKPIIFAPFYLKYENILLYL